MLYGFYENTGHKNDMFLFFLTITNSGRRGLVQFLHWLDFLGFGALVLGLERVEPSRNSA